MVFQAGSAAVDSATIMSALIWQLSGSSVLVGSVSAILRFGWLMPQLIVGFLAQRAGSSMRYYAIGAFGRAAAMAALAGLLWLGAGWPRPWLSAAVLALWGAYAFVSGIVGVPYNDIVARAVPADLRARLLAARFFGGGLLALGVAGLADRIVTGLAFPLSYSVVIALAAGLMFLSAGIFTAMGEPAPASGPPGPGPSFRAYLGEGLRVLRADRRFRGFVLAQWCGGAVAMAMPFYVVAAARAGMGLERVALLLGAQTLGALLSNPLWGWWGDRLGKASLLGAIAAGRILPPLMALALLGSARFFAGKPDLPFALFAGLFFVAGALANGLTIAVIGYLMEISPEDRRPAWSGYFNAITAPAFLMPFLGGLVVAAGGLWPVFALSALAAAAQWLALMRIGVNSG